MKFEFGDLTIQLPPLMISLILIAIIYFLWKWSKELDNRRFTIFLYFLISTYIAPLYSQSTKNDGQFVLWFPLGFVVIMFYLYANKRNHPAKMKASLLGLAVALYRLIVIYMNLLV